MLSGFLLLGGAKILGFVLVEVFWRFVLMEVKVCHALLMLERFVCVESDVVTNLGYLFELKFICPSVEFCCSRQGIWFRKIEGVAEISSWVTCGVVSTILLLWRSIVSGLWIISLGWASICSFGEKLSVSHLRFAKLRPKTSSFLSLAIGSNRLETCPSIDCVCCTWGCVCRQFLPYLFTILSIGGKSSFVNHLLYGPLFLLCWLPPLCSSSASFSSLICWGWSRIEVFLGRPIGCFCGLSFSKFLWISTASFKMSIYFARISSFSPCVIVWI